MDPFDKELHRRRMVVERYNGVLEATLGDACLSFLMVFLVILMKLVHSSNNKIALTYYNLPSPHSVTNSYVWSVSGGILA
jgi:hypothetical protein